MDLVQQLMLQTRNTVTGLVASLPVPHNQPTPISPNFPHPAITVQLPAESLSNWHDYAATLYSGQMGAEPSAALTALGDCLLHNDMAEAAHCWYVSTSSVCQSRLLICLVAVTFFHRCPRPLVARVYYRPESTCSEHMLRRRLWGAR